MALVIVAEGRVKSVAGIVLNAGELGSTDERLGSSNDLILC